MGLKKGIFPFDHTAQYKTDSFSCGRPELDDFLKTMMARQQNRNVLRAHVIVTDDPIPEIMGYYTLSGASVVKEVFSGTRQRQIVYPDAPCILLGRLAVDERVAGRRFGTALVAHAAMRVFESAQTVGVYAMFTAAKDEKAAEFYEKLGFLKAKTNDDSLAYFYPTSNMEELISKFSF